MGKYIAEKYAIYEGHNNEDYMSKPLLVIIDSNKKGRSYVSEGIFSTEKKGIKLKYIGYGSIKGSWTEEELITRRIKQSFDRETMYDKIPNARMVTENNKQYFYEETEASKYVNYVFAKGGFLFECTVSVDLNNPEAVETYNEIMNYIGLNEMKIE